MIALMMAAALMQGDARCNAADAAAGQTGCPAWRLLPRNMEDRMFVDPASVRRTGDTLQINVRVVYVREQPGGVRSYINRLRLDCAGRMGSVTHMTLFDAGGRQIDDWEMTGDPAVPRPAPPGTPSAVILDEYCPH